MDFTNSNEMQIDEARYAELEMRIDKLLELNIKHEQERDEAFSLIETLYSENQSLRFELDNSRNDYETSHNNQITILNSAVDELKAELDKSSEISSRNNQKSLKTAYHFFLI